MDLTQQFFNTIAKSGFQVEQMVNRSIQKHLNKTNFVKSAAGNANGIARAMNTLQNTVETLSIPLNFPTKNDLANTNSLVVQSEEKIDHLEDRIIALTAAIRDLQSNLSTANQTQRARKRNGSRND